MVGWKRGIVTKPEAIIEGIRRVDAGDPATQVEPGTQPTRPGWKVEEMIKKTNAHAYRPRS